LKSDEEYILFYSIRNILVYNFRYIDVGLLFMESPKSKCSKRFASSYGGI
jgi:hypothetical protein